MQQRVSRSGSVVWCVVAAITTMACSQTSGNSGRRATGEPAGTETGGETGFDPSATGGSGGADATASPDAPGAATGGTPTGAGSGSETGTDVAPELVSSTIDSPELFLQIVGPSARDHIAVGGSVTYLAGTMFGKADKISWQSATETGSAVVGRFWKTGPITLQPGDNVIDVKAVAGQNESHDSITITYNPGFDNLDVPNLRPRSILAGTTVNVSVTLPVRSKTLVPSSVVLWEVDAVGNTLGKAGGMVDDGNTADPSCDEIQDDGIFSVCAKLTAPSAGMRYFRVSLETASEGNTYTIYSAIVPIEVVAPIAVADCEAMQTALKEGRAAYDGAIAGGHAAAAQAAAAALQKNAAVQAAGPSDGKGGVWARFTNGALGALSTPAPGFRGTGDGSGGANTASLLNPLPIQSKKVLALSPSSAELGDHDEIKAITTLLNQQICPDFEVDGPHVGAQASLARLRLAERYGVLLFAGHIEAYFGGLDGATKTHDLHWEHDGSQEILWTGEPTSCQAFAAAMPVCHGEGTCAKKSQECVITQADQGKASVTGVCVDHTQIDLARGRVVMGDSTWGVHPAFFRAHTERRWPSSLAYLGGCKSMYTGTLASELFALGAKAIAGYTDAVHNIFAAEEATAWFKAMLEERAATGHATHFPRIDPGEPHAALYLFGGTNVVITDASLINGSFETNDTTGWDVEGDGRVISQLGASIPVTGKFMGVISTGLGYTQETGQLTQTFCIPENAEKASFYWKFFSEEFQEYCGTVYQDTFQATLESASGKRTLIDVKVDDLCPTSACSGCGGKYVGLAPSDVSFDIGGVYNTQWQHTEVKVSDLAGKGPVTLRLFATDQGDSVYDTVILLDSIDFR